MSTVRTLIAPSAFRRLPPVGGHGCEPESVENGMPVTVVFDRVTDEVVLPKFRPHEAGNGGENGDGDGNEDGGEDGWE